MRPHESCPKTSRRNVFEEHLCLIVAFKRPICLCVLNDGFVRLHEIDGQQQGTGHDTRVGVQERRFTNIYLRV